MSQHIHNPSDIPTTPHLAVIYTESFTIPGDERSRQCPGHGYPESTETSWKYVLMSDEADLTKWIETRNRYGERRDFRVIRAQAVTVTISVQVKLEP